MQRLSIRFDLVALILAVTWLLAILLVPPEQTLGTLLRWGVRSRQSDPGLTAAIPRRRDSSYPIPIGRKTFYGWMEIAGWVALVLWVLGFVLSTIPAKLSWGVWIDFSEPRTQMTLQVLAAGIIFLLLTLCWVDHPTFTAVAQLVLSGLALFLNRSAGVVRHPLNPIGTSGSDIIPMLYSLIFLLALADSICLIAYWHSRRYPSTPNNDLTVP